MNFPNIPDHQIEKIIGAGGMAVVYLATHTTMGNKRAVKVMQQHLVSEEGFRGNFLNEGQIVAKLNHQNIVQIYDMKISGDICYMSMEYLDDGTLKDKLKHHKLSVEESIYILQQVGAGLNHAHNHNYIHRDIKPANILFKSDGSIKLADFGISKLQNISGDLTLIGLSPGTPSYMCPEQRNSAQIDKRCDIYSLGLVFYEMLTGKKVVHSDTNTQAIFTHTLSPVLPPQYQYLQLTLNKALAKKPEDRYNSVPEFLNDLIRESQPKSSFIISGTPSATEHQQQSTYSDNAPTVIRDNASQDFAPTVIKTDNRNQPPSETTNNKKKKSKAPVLLASLAILAGGTWYANEELGFLAELDKLLPVTKIVGTESTTEAEKQAAAEAEKQA
ncbi:MAG: serine/threonine-protein kinase, partial [Thiolinea sp.]